MSDVVITWICDSCREPIAADSGALHINTQWLERSTVSRRTAEDFAEETWPHTDALRIIDAVDLLAAPKTSTAPWQVHHVDCGPEGSWGYGIDVSRISRIADVLRWTLHFQRKGWLDVTNWMELAELALASERKTLADHG